MYGKINENLYVDNGGEVEYYILRESEGEYIAHAFRQDGDVWKHWKNLVIVTEEILANAVETYGPEDAYFLAAMEDLQQWSPGPEELTDGEKQDIINSLSA